MLLTCNATVAQSLGIQQSPNKWLLESAWCLPGAWLGLGRAHTQNVLPAHLIHSHAELIFGGMER